jgi:predicted O-methyltransferase YrrM
MKNYLRVLANLSPANLWGYLSHPSMIPVYLNCPRRSSLGEITRTLFPGTSETEVENVRLELLLKHDFFQQLDDAMVKTRGRRTSFQGWVESLYVITRLLRPRVVVETGVFDGLSSSFILQAMKDNGVGKLISIDLPAQDTIRGSTHRMRESTLPPNCGPGWVIPNCLRERQEMILGDSKVLLPAVLAEQREIDVFLHDSLHTFEHQWFEYSAAWPALSSGGLLLSDDIFWNAAFHRFCAKVGRLYMIHEGLGVAQRGGRSA